MSRQFRPDRLPYPDAIVIFDDGYGDGGKGRIVSHNVRWRHASTVVKYSGGAQCAHHVMDSTGRSHTFAQFGAGTLEGARTHLSRHFLLNPLNMGREAERLIGIGVTDPMSLVTIDENCPIITPFHRAANRLRELDRGDNRHGSCGQGIGETASDLVTDPGMILRAGDLRTPFVVRDKLAYWQDRKRRLFARAIADLDAPSTAYAAELAVLIAHPSDELFDSYQRFADDVDIVPGSHLGRILNDGTPTVFEGAQGVLLDEWYGFHPYTTWSTTGPDNAMTLLAELGVPRTSIEVQAVMRPYMTRHGAGPFPTESAELGTWLQDGTNHTGKWQGPFRVGHFDAVALTYGLNCVEHVSGIHVDKIAFTNCDRLVGLQGFNMTECYNSPSGPVHALPLPERGNLDRQAELTAAFDKFTPSYRPVRTSNRADVEQFLDHLSRNVFHKPISANTWGPATGDDVSWATMNDLMPGVGV